MRRWWLRAGFVLATILVAACAGATPSASPPAATPAPATQAPTAAAGESPAGEPSASARPAVSLRFGTSSPRGFPDTPTLAAFDALREEQNIDVEFISFNSGDDTIRALLADEVDIAVVFPSGIMPAAREGTVKLFFNSKANEWLLVCKSDITDPSQLSGKRIGRHSGNDLSAALVNHTVAKYKVTPELLNIEGSENRVVALLQDQLDCSFTDVAGTFVLEAERPGEFKPLLRYSDEVPDLVVTQHHVARVAAMEEDPETWKLLVTYLVKFHRMAADDADFLATAADKYFPDEDPALHKEQAQGYVDFKVFTRDGGLNRERMEKLIQFYVDNGALSRRGRAAVRRLRDDRVRRRGPRGTRPLARVARPGLLPPR